MPPLLQLSMNWFHFSQVHSLAHCNCGFVVGGYFAQRNCVGSKTIPLIPADHRWEGPSSTRYSNPNWARVVLSSEQAILLRQDSVINWYRWKHFSTISVDPYPSLYRCFKSVAPNEYFMSNHGIVKFNSSSYETSTESLQRQKLAENDQEKTQDHHSLYYTRL